MEGILCTRRRPPEEPLRLRLGSEFDTLLGNKTKRRNCVTAYRHRYDDAARLTIPGSIDNVTVSTGRRTGGSWSFFCKQTVLPSHSGGSQGYVRISKLLWV
jgi:hypothetical protein